MTLHNILFRTYFYTLIVLLGLLAFAHNAKAAATVYGVGTDEIHIEGGTGTLVYYYGLEQPETYGDYRGEPAETDVAWFGWYADSNLDHAYDIPGIIWFLEDAENYCDTGATYEQCRDFANATPIGCYYTDGETWEDLTAQDCTISPPEPPATTTVNVIVNVDNEVQKLFYGVTIFYAVMFFTIWFFRKRK